jgi:hypothetical protein
MDRMLNDCVRNCPIGEWRIMKIAAFRIADPMRPPDAPAIINHCARRNAARAARFRTLS